MAPSWQFAIEKPWFNGLMILLSCKIHYLDLMKGDSEGDVC